ncbi:MAG: hypothetical protein LQ349_005096 [Xanthoria aureola]|nr:MAG: hypothetical protein LQ349_005096 [Xanthoria aureola]
MEKIPNREHGIGSYEDPSDTENYESDPESDLEKAPYSRQTPSARYRPRDTPSAYSSSSRETSASHQHLLSTSPNKRKSTSYFYKIPQRVVRYMNWALLSTMIIIAICLIRASYRSSRQVEMGTVEKSAPKPPPWEAFPFLKRYHGGIRTLLPKKKNTPEYPHDQQVMLNISVTKQEIKPLPKSVPYDPYPPAAEGYAKKHDCFLDAAETVKVPPVHYYPGVVKGFPEAVMGSHEVLGLRDDICFDRFGRLGPYGYGYSAKRGGTGAGLHGDREGADDLWEGPGNTIGVDYSSVEWVKAQAACATKNAGRFRPIEKPGENPFLDLTADGQQASQENGKESGPSLVEDDSVVGKRDEHEVPTAGQNETVAEPTTAQKKALLLPRTAILIRTWWDFHYTAEDVIYLRSLIAELSLLSGGEFAVHFLVHVRDDNVPIWADKRIYNRILENALPVEFRGLGTLWSERQMGLIYGGIEESFFRDLPVHGVYRSTFMPVQYFSHQHPEYDFVWNWEMDVRYTGHWYHFFDQIRKWTKSQPRKGLWERNGRFYIPSVHGSWEDFKQMVRVQTEMGTDSPNNIWSGLKSPTGGSVPGSRVTQAKSDKSIWGPEPPPDVLTNQNDEEPPTSYEKDRYEWGVGEEADLITFNPLFDPDGTTWFFTEDITGYNTTASLPPRRAAITTTSRLSKRLLTLMHRETVLKRHTMFSEMWPASVSLHHGLKAVYAPHPMYIDRDWPPSYLAAVMNGGRNGASGGARTSVYGGREHNFKGTTWFYDAGFAPNLWRRWLGMKVDNDGGEREEVAGEGRMCLPGVLLHPVKGVELVVEGVGRVGEEVDTEREWEEKYGT